MPKLEVKEGSPTKFGEPSYWKSNMTNYFVIYLCLISGLARQSFPQANCEVYSSQAVNSAIKLIVRF